MNATPTPDEARALLEQAAHTTSASRKGASWAHIAGLLGLGAASSLALPALAYVPRELRLLPLLLLFAWVGALFAFAAVFGSSVKQGFGRRWTATILIWGIVWAVGVVGTSWLFEGQVWFLVLASVALTVVTLVGAWVEARR